MDRFIGEDDLKTFDGWLDYQGVHPSSVDELEVWRREFAETRERCIATPKIGLMKLQPITNEHRYAVAVRERSDLLLALWVRCSSKGEFFVLRPVSDRTWDPHTSYHLDGRLHIKSYDTKILTHRRQPLTDTFRGTEDLGSYSGFGPKGVGAVCDPTLFDDVVEISPAVLGPKHGCVKVDLVEPGCEPTALPWTRIFTRRVFAGTFPRVVITVGWLG